MLDVALLAAAALLTTGPVLQEPAPAAQDPIGLEDVVVERRTLEEATREFVEAVADPVPRRGLARWHRGVCVGVVNLNPEAAQLIVDRISDIARELELTAGEPGCQPSIVVIAAADGAAFARAFVEREPMLFRPGGSGMDQGGSALRAFVEGDRPVRWWNVTQPTDADTGLSATRVKGQSRGSGGSVTDYAPITYLRNSGRLANQYRQDIKRTFVIVDVDRLQGASLTQIADYVAMVSLAQIDPDANVERFDSILNVFAGLGGAPGLTGWDRAYLNGLYASEWYRISSDSQVSAITSAVRRSYRDGEPVGEAPEPAPAPE